MKNFMTYLQRPKNYSIKINQINKVAGALVSDTLMLFERVHQEQHCLTTVKKISFNSRSKMKVEKQSLGRRSLAFRNVTG